MSVCPSVCKLLLKFFTSTSTKLSINNYYIKGICEFFSRVGNETFLTFVGIFQKPSKNNLARKYKTYGAEASGIVDLAIGLFK